MEVIAAVVGSVISTLCTQNCLCGSHSQQCNYLRKHQEKSEQLKNRMEDLWDQADHLKRKLDLAKLQEGKEPQAKVVRWLGKVERIKDEVDSLMEKVGERKQCLYGCFPNCHSRLKMGKQIEDKTNKVNQLLDQGQFSDDQLTELQLEKGKPLPTTTLVGKTTAERNFEQIWDSIFDNSVSRIGVYGMGGVGKTTIMQNIHNRLLKGGTGFDHIIWITVSKESYLEKLQNDIGKKLDLDFRDDEDKLSRASKLLVALERRKRFILILDDMWEAFPLENVGIPNPTRENGCKLLLTTRLKGVCRGMETERNVEVRVLSKDEAWDLFKQKVGEDVLHSSDIQALAKDVAKECDGLPLALITVGRALRQVDDVMEWKNALNELRTSIADIEGFQDEVFKSLRFSYSRLKDDKIRDCFLYCALYPEDEEVSVEELIEHWIGEGFINDLERREDQICKGKTILNELKYASMLEEGHYYRGKNREVVKMHDLVRDLAIRIQSPTCMIKAGLRLTKVPRDTEWMESLERVSLVGNELKELMGEPKCPKLTSLLLHCNGHLRDISPRFFQQMYNLRVVNLSGTGIKSLPKSLVELENLRALLLQGCSRLKKLPLVANLRLLGTLDLSFTSVTELPPGMEMLVNLRRLDLWNCHLKMFPANLLQKLTHLEDLSVELSGGEEPEGEKAEESKGEETEEEPDGEEPEGEKAEESKGEETVEVEEADGEEGEESKGEEPDGEGEETDEEEAELTPFLEELINNTHLRSLHVNFRNSKNFNSYIGSGHWRQLASFSIVSHPRSEPKLAGKNHISIQGGGMNVRGTWLMLPETTHQLDMRNCDTITRLSMCLPKSTKLRVCSIEGCMNMECIVMDGENNLPSLRRMNLEDLPKLSSLCKGVVAPGTLSSLKELLVKKCNNTKNLLTRGLLQHLQSLEWISVSFCSEMEEIIVGIMGEEDGDEKEKGEAGMMSGGGNKNEGNNNSIITLPSPTSLPGHNNYLPSLQRMFLLHLQKLRSLCKGVVTPGTLSSLKVLHVFQCNNMKNLLTRGLLQHLQSLEEITVIGCYGMEEIIGGEGEEDDKERGGEEGIINNGTINNNAIITAILPRLHTLELSNLPELKSICSRGVMVCNSLQTIHVDKCPKLKKLPIVSMEEDDNNGGIRLMGAPPGVKKIIANNKKWWDLQTSDHPDAHTFLQPFKTRSMTGQFNWAFIQMP